MWPRLAPEGTGSVAGSDCFCRVNTYLPAAEALKAVGDCAKCPEGAQCAGGSASPVALPGYWLFEGERPAQCTLAGCRGSNMCADGYRDQFQCEMCDVGYYPDQIKNTCEVCTTWRPRRHRSAALAAQVRYVAQLALRNEGRPTSWVPGLSCSSRAISG